MVSKEKNNRINQLARKQKCEGLTDEEKEEQACLRQEYLKAFRESFIKQLEAIEIVDTEVECSGDTFKN